MNKTLAEITLCSMKPNVFYRAAELAVEANLNKNSIASCLEVLALGGVIVKIKDGRRAIYITKQAELF